MNRKINIIILVIIMAIILIPTKSFGTISKDDFSGVSVTNLSGPLGDLASTVYNLVLMAGATISAIYIIILGIKYMLSSTEDRADIKKRLIPFVIGVALFFGSNLFINLLIAIAAQVNAG